MCKNDTAAASLAINPKGDKPNEKNSIALIDPELPTNPDKNPEIKPIDKIVLVPNVISFNFISLKTLKRIVAIPRTVLIVFLGSSANPKAPNNESGKDVIKNKPTLFQSISLNPVNALVRFAISITIVNIGTASSPPKKNVNIIVINAAPPTADEPERNAAKNATIETITYVVMSIFRLR